MKESGYNLLQKNIRHGANQDRSPCAEGVSNKEMGHNGLNCIDRSSPNGESSSLGNV